MLCLALCILSVFLSVTALLLKGKGRVHLQ